jgi:predicted transcriptional regulator
MTAHNQIQNKALFEKVKVISNALRFHILELTQSKELSITQLATALQLSYTKTADYVKMLEDLELISKSKKGKEVKVKSKVMLKSDVLIFGHT